MAPDAIASRFSSLGMNSNGPSVHGVEGSKHGAVPIGRTPRRSFDGGRANRTISDVSAEISRSCMNLDVNLHAVMNLKVQKAQCECCGMSEDCTPSYINRVRDLFCGRWVCGLCAEAVKEERRRMGKAVPMEDALRSHMAVCVKFNKVALSNPALLLAESMREILKKSSRENGLRSNPNCPRDRAVGKNTITRSTSCIPAIVRK